MLAQKPKQKQKTDDKWDWVKQERLLAENKPLDKWIADMERKRRNRGMGEVVAPPPLSADSAISLQRIVGDKRKVFDGKIPDGCFFVDYSESDLRGIMAEQRAVIDLLKEHKQSKFLANRILFIFDDLVGSSLFNNARDNPFKMLNTNHRHYSASVLMVSQAYKELPKTIRTQFSCLVAFEIPNEREVEVIYEENPMSLKRDAWKQMYDYAVEGDHSFLFVNYQKPKRLRLMRNFEDVLFFQ